MAMDFSQLRKSRGALESLQKEVEKLATKTNRDDTRFWQPTVDKADNGSAVIRFLPPPQGEDLPWVQVWSHGFQGPTGLWYIENSLTTLGKDDPVSELNSTLWNSGTESDKDIARAQKRKLNYIANILVVKDPGNPDNEGKVFLFKFGKKIFDKIKDIMKPEFEDEAPVNPFDMWTGANFKMKIRRYEGYRNYDKSEFAEPSAISNNDVELEALWKQEHSLQAFVTAENFKSYDELKARLNKVLNPAGGPKATAAAAKLDEDQPPVAAVPMREAKPRAAPAVEEDDDSTSYFEKLAAGE